MSEIKHIASSIHDYAIHFEDDISFMSGLLETENAVFIIDKNVYNIYAELLKTLDGNLNLVVIDAIEENKTLVASEQVFDRIIALNPTKKTKIISIGGGIIQDVSGFVASTFYRGLKWVYVPTTLLSQSDSCMGSKTSLNYKSYKNILGTFYPPHQIYICPNFTDSLNDLDFYSGMGEVAKLHIMGGASALKTLMGWLPGIYSRDIATILSATKSALNIKWTYMDGDEFDQGKRNLLNYGHEFGHAIETATHYGIPHGQAVIIGMILANMYATENGALSKEMNDQIAELLFALLKCDYKQLNVVDEQLVIGAMKQDKKRVGSGLPLILTNSGFELYKITDMSEKDALTCLRNFKSNYCS